MKKYNLDDILPLEEVEEYIAHKVKVSQKIDWNKLLRIQRFSDEFLEKYCAYEGFNWRQVSKYQHISEEFIEKHIATLECDLIKGRMKLSKEIIDKYPKQLDNKIIMKELIERGWTKSIVAKFYPDHEKYWYKRDKVCYLYCVSIVEKIEATEEFKKAVEKSIVRRNTANKSRDERNNKLIDIINGMDIRIPFKDLNDLKREAIKSWEEWNTWKLLEGRKVESTKWEPGFNTEDTKRITCNYIRHELTNYDEMLSHFLNNFNKNNVYDPLHEKYMNAIYEKYPELKPKPVEHEVE